MDKNAYKSLHTVRYLIQAYTLVEFTRFDIGKRAYTSLYTGKRADTSTDERA